MDKQIILTLTDNGRLQMETPQPLTNYEAHMLLSYFVSVLIEADVEQNNMAPDEAYMRVNNACATGYDAWKQRRPHLVIAEEIPEDAEALKPCPCCGDAEPVYTEPQELDGCVAVKCTECGFATGFYRHRRYAREAWNKADKATSWPPKEEE